MFEVKPAGSTGRSRAARSLRTLFTSFSVGLAVITAVLVSAASSATAVGGNAYTWNGATSGTYSWEDATKWTTSTGTTGKYPGMDPGDSATFNGFQQMTVQVTSSIANPVMLTNAGTGVNVSVNSVGDLTLISSQIQTSSSGLPNKVTVSGGTLRLAGTAPSLSVSTAGAFPAKPVLQFDGGTISGGTITVDPTTTMNLGGAAPKTLRAVNITNNGTVNYNSSSGLLDFLSSAILNNAAAATFSLSNSLDINSSDATGIINNSGTTTQAVTTGGSTTLNTVFNNLSGGTVGFATTSGSITLAAGGTHAGAFNGNLSTMFKFNGPNTFNTGASFAGCGGCSTFLTGGTFTDNAGLFIDNFTQQGGTLAGSATTTLRNLTWTAGTQTSSGTGVTVIPATYTASLQGNTTALTLSGSRQFQNAGTLTYNPAAGLPLSIDNTAFINNTGVFTLSNDEPINSLNPTTAHIDTSGSGSVRKNGTTGPSHIYPLMNLSGNALVIAETVGGGTIVFMGGGSAGGTGVQINAKDVTHQIAFGGGTMALNPGTSFAGAGSFRTLFTATLHILTAVTAPSFIHDDTSVIQGTGSLTVPGTYTWNGGTMDGAAGAGSVILSGSTAVMNIAGAGGLTKVTNGYGIVDNGGTINYTSTASNLIVNSGGHIDINGAGSFLIKNAVPIISDNLSSPVITVSSGSTLSKTLSGGTSSINVPVSVSGTISSSGPIGSFLSLAGGGTVNGAMTISTGNTIAIPSATLILGSTVTESGAGKLLVNGGTIQANSPTTIGSQFEIASGTLSGTGTVTLASGGIWHSGTMSGGGSTAVPLGQTLDASMLTGPITLDNRTLDNNGTLILDPTASSFPLNLNNTSILKNNAGATFTIKNGGNLLTNAVGSNSVVNNGTIQKTIGLGGYRFDVPVSNASGTIDSQAGTIIINGGGSSTGALKATVSGAFLDFFGGTFTITGGSLAGPGAIRITGAGANLTVTNPLTAPPDFRQLNGALTLAAVFSVPSGATYSWSGGQIKGSSGGGFTVNSGGLLAIDSSTNPLAFDVVPLTIASTGTAVWTGSNSLTLQNGSSLSNSGTFDAQAGGTNMLFAGSPIGTLTSSGTFKKTVSTLGLAINGSSAFNGPLTVQSGPLSLAGGGSIGGAVSISSGAELHFPSSTFNLVSPATISGAGTFVVDGGTVNLSTAAINTATPFLFTNGTIGLTQPLTLTGPLTWSGGTFSSGNVSAANTTIQISSFSPTVSAGTFTNTGTVTVNGSGAPTALTLQSGATFVNNSGATFDLTGDRNISSGAINGFTNNGLLKKSNSSGSGSAIFGNFINGSSGTVAVQVGGLAFRGNSADGVSSSDTGAYTTTSATAILEFASGTRTINAPGGIGPLASGSSVVFSGGTLTNNGPYNSAGSSVSTSISGGTVLFNNAGTAQTSGFTMTSGALLGTGPFQINGSGTWSGGTIGGGGSNLIIAPTGALTIDGANSTPALSSRTIADNGILRYTAAINPLTFSNGDVNVGASSFFDILTDQPINGNGSIVSAGTFKKSGGSGTTVVAPIVSSSGTVAALAGTLDFKNGFTQTAGLTQLSGGNVSASAAAFNLNAGSLTGAGTVSTIGGFFNGGTVDPGTPSTPGTINVNGVYSQSPGGTLRFDLASPTSYDILNVTGSASLNGALVVATIGGFMPAGGQSFPVLNFASNGGTDFSSKTLPPVSGGVMQAVYQPAGSPTQLVLQAVAQADLGVTVSGPPSINASQTASYNVAVNNAGPGAASNVSLSISVTGGTITGAAGGGWTCSTTTTTASCTLVSLSSATTASLSLTLTAPAQGSISVSATTSSATSDPSTANNNASFTTAVNPVADLAIVKSLSGSLTAGQNATYTVTISNAGPSSSSAYTVLDPTPAGLTFVSNSGGCTTPYPCSMGNLNAGQSTVITSTYAVAPGASGSISNTASISGSVSDSNPSNNSSTATSTVTPGADLSANVTGPATINTAQTATYTITFGNAGPGSASSSTATINLSGGTIASTSSTSFTCSASGGSSVTCTSGALAAGSSNTITLVATPAPAGGSMTLSASITSPTVDPSTANNNASFTTTVTTAADLSITKTLSGSLTAGQNAVYTVTVTNAGPSTSSTYTINDTTPAGLTFVSNSGGCTTAYPCTMPPLAAGQSTTITSTYSVPAGASGSISNTATIAGATNDPNPANNSSTATTTVVSAGADLSIVKSGPSSAAVGSTVTYSLVVTNGGPVTANNISIADATPTGMTLVSAGVCGSSFPCNVGTLASGQSVTVTTTYSILQGATGTITNTASVTSSTADPVSTNNTSSTTLTVNACPSVPGNPLPAEGVINIATSGTIRWSASGADSYNVYLGLAGTGCSTLVGNVPGTSYPYTNLQAGVAYEYRIEALRPGCPPQSTACVHFTTATSCNALPPTLLFPIAGTTPSNVVTSPVTFRWTAVTGATSYDVFAGSSASAAVKIGTTTATSLTADVSGTVTWYVIATVPGCGPLQSSAATFAVCSPVSAPIVSVVGESTSGTTYDVLWTAVAGASSYQIDEATNDAFTDAVSRTVTATSSTFTHEAPKRAQAYFYRVRAFATCSQQPGPFSETVRVIILPLPPPAVTNPSVNVPAGSKRLVVQQVLIPGQSGGTFTYAARIDKPWLAVTPATGILPPDGVILDVTADPSELPNGTFTGTVIVSITQVGATGSNLRSNAASAVSVPVSVNLVTPVTSTGKTSPQTNSLVIPSVGHLDGFNSQWQSDVRVSNIGNTRQSYQLLFTPDDPSKGSKSTTIDIDANGTTALDDIVRNWYGIGSIGDSANGTLEIRPVIKSGKGIVSDELSKATTVASSRTYNVSSNGTLGQYIPAIPFANFIGRVSGSQLQQVLSLQQIANSEAYRTNVGLVEASGQSASVAMSIFNGAGVKLLELPFTLKGGQQLQLNGLLANNNIKLDDGRIEVKVTGGEGKVTAYASVVDNKTNDPLLVSGVPLNAVKADRYILPGVADINTGLASWRTDMRIFNGGTSSQPASLIFFAQNNSAAPQTKEVTIAAGEVRTLDNIVQSLFGRTDIGGAVHVVTPASSSLIVTGRTYNKTADGTFGQFIPAVTQSDAVGRTDRALQILQVEDSVRYRTNIGLAEVSGKPVTVEIAITLPDSKVSPVITYSLGANEFRQVSTIRDLALGNIYNARIAIRAVEGDGKVTAYGSVIDQATQDPTYVPAQ